MGWNHQLSVSSLKSWNSWRYSEVKTLATFRLMFLGFGIESVVSPSQGRRNPRWLGDHLDLVGHFKEEISYPKHQFSEDVSMFRVVVIIIDFRNFGKVVVSNLFYSHSDSCGNDPIWWAYFSNGLKPPTRRCHVRCFFNLSNVISKWKSVMFLLVIPIDISSNPIRTRWGIYDILYIYICMICIYWIILIKSVFIPIIHNIPTVYQI